jgi:3-phosphoshikimate 1-carboxyvinyltransferase
MTEAADRNDGGTVTDVAQARVPGDKSISHRALMFAALATGSSRLRGVLPAADTISTAESLRGLGVGIPPIPEDGSEIVIRGVGLRGLHCDGAALDCGNSGTTARLLAGILAASAARATLDGDESLRRRPMDRVVEPLRTMGARIRTPDDASLPLAFEPARLEALDYASPVASAQVKSALLLAGLVAGVPVTVREPRRSRDHTERLLRAMGAQVGEVAATGGDPTHAVSIEPTDALEPLDLDVPGDPSSAAFLAGLAAIVPEARLRLPGVSTNPTRTAFFEVLATMGVEVDTPRRATTPGRPDTAAGEPMGDITVRAGALRGVTVEGERVPSLIDELPLIAVLGALAEGETRIRGAAELRMKESDRIATTVAGLRAVGAHAEELPDGLIVTGGKGPLRGRVTTHGDHRIAMAFGVLGAAPGNAIKVDDPACAAVSYPGFWAERDRLLGLWKAP